MDIKATIQQGNEEDIKYNPNEQYVGTFENWELEFNKKFPIKVIGCKKMGGWVENGKEYNLVNEKEIKDWFNKQQQKLAEAIISEFEGKPLKRYEPGDFLYHRDEHNSGYNMKTREINNKCKKLRESLTK